MGRPNLAKSSRRRSAISVAVPTVDRAVRTGFFCSMAMARSEEHTSELQSRLHLVCRLLLEKKKEGHARPYVSSDTNPHDFGFGRGLKNRDYVSFPSGQTSAAFSGEAAVVAETPYLRPQSS